MTILLLTALLTVAQHIQASYPVVYCKYSARVVFENMSVDDHILTGEIRGVIEAKYTYRDDVVVVSRRYLEYELKGLASLVRGVIWRTC